MATDEKQNPNPSISQDNIYDILLKLPVKTLLRCMSVCKSWFSIISSDGFVKTHLSKSTNHPHFAHNHLFIEVYAGPIFETCSVYSLLNEAVTDPIKIESPTKQYRTRVVGYCNGLVCLADQDANVYLWNPSTRKSRTLPRCCSRPLLTFYYFCYDDSDNDFKVFGTPPQSYYEECKMWVYSSKSDCWRKVGDFSFYVRYGVVCANGAFYWVVNHSGNYFKSNIISLEIKTGTYREVLQPDCAKGTYSYFNMNTFGKTTLSACYYGKETRADLWVMNCGAEESWIKLFTNSYVNGLALDYFAQPLCICANGDIMLSSKSQILLYNSEDKTFKVLFDKGVFKHPKVCMYVESLVSPFFKPEQV